MKEGNLIRTKRITIGLFATLSSMFFFLTGQIPIRINTPYLSASSGSPPSSIVEVEEVNQFLNNYAALYARKDIDGFLSLFSLKAVQNDKEGITEIRRIYTDFFNKSDSLEYRMEANIRISQGVAEVKGRYKIQQLTNVGTNRGQMRVWVGWIKLVLSKEDGVLRIISIDYQPDKSQ